MKIPKRFLTSKYRKDMWRNVNAMVEKISKVLPIKATYMMGSFTTKKRRPADVDFIVILETKSKTSAPWSVDMVLAPDTAYGAKIIKDARKWMKQKYGSKKSAFLRIK